MDMDVDVDTKVWRFKKLLCMTPYVCLHGRCRGSGLRLVYMCVRGGIACSLLYQAWLFLYNVITVLYRVYIYYIIDNMTDARGRAECSCALLILLDQWLYYIILYHDIIFMTPFYVTSVIWYNMLIWYDIIYIIVFGISRRRSACPRTSCCGNMTW